MTLLYTVLQPWLKAHLHQGLCSSTVQWPQHLGILRTLWNGSHAPEFILTLSLLRIHTNALPETPEFSDTQSYSQESLEPSSLSLWKDKIWKLFCSNSIWCCLCHMGFTRRNHPGAGIRRPHISSGYLSNLESLKVSMTNLTTALCL